MNLVNVGYDSTNYYLLEPDRSGLLIDVGWPGTMPKLFSILKRKGVAFQKIKYLLVTHYHPDHAGLVQEMKEQGVRLIVIDSQVAFIPMLARYMKPKDHYRKISLEDNIDLSAGESRSVLSSIGISGEIIYTPGHSDDSMTLILDEGIAFTGDLPNPFAIPGDPGSQVELSWSKIRSYPVKTVYPAHGPVMKFE
jgi:ribonuclease/clavin/mitogillin